MSQFRFVSYGFVNGSASFTYADDDRHYTERVEFATSEYVCDAVALDRALMLAFLVIGTSYYKVTPTRDVVFEHGSIDDWQAQFCNHVYQEGLSQYAFENQLTRDDLAQFSATTGESISATAYEGEGILSMQSGGKDSLLVARLLEQHDMAYTPWYITSSEQHPAVLDRLASPLVTATRLLDREALAAAAQQGGRNGHIPVTYVAMSLALIQAMLLGKNTVLAAIAHEGDEPHGWIGDLPVNHQWSKTWQAEQLFAEYVRRYVSPSVHIGSPLRSMSELKVAELFTTHAWPIYGNQFSSCNVANYKQGENNTELRWCGNCPKCANAYLLFAPFMDPEVLQARLGGDLFAKASLVDTFKGLLGIDGVMKPFECVGETDELRAAYHMALAHGYTSLPFVVPTSDFDKDQLYDAQRWIPKLDDKQTKG